MPSQEQLEHYAKREASSPSSVCKHVLNGTNVAAFGNGGICWFAACCEECLYSRDQVTILTEHLTDRQPELAALLHLPIYACAILREGGWWLEIMKPKSTLSEFDNGVHTKRDKETFLGSGEKFYAASGFGIFHADVFESGARFFPIWSSKGDLRKYMGRSLINQIFTKFNLLSPR